MEPAQGSPALDFQPNSEPVRLILPGQLSPQDLLIDVRSPAEFADDHIPNAINVPLLDDQERSKVGALYRLEGVESATDWALSQLRARLQQFLSQLEAHIQPGARVAICCARGGDRSRHVVQFLRQVGHDAYQLEDGYRGYRSEVRQVLSKVDYPNLFVLDGLTGTGKTRVLRAMAHSRPGSVIDLEDYAQHRSSLLGDVGLQPTSQKLFESRMYQFWHAHHDSESWYLVEAESRKVGNREIPLSLWNQMKSAQRIQLSATMAIRCRILEADYQTEEGWGPLIQRLQSLVQHSDYSSNEIDQLCEQLVDGNVAEVAQDLLQKHYDPRYQHQMQDHSPLKTFEVEEPEDLAASIIAYLDGQIAS